MKLSMGLLSEDQMFAKSIAQLLAPNFNTYWFSDEEEIYLWLEECGDEVDSLVIDCKNSPSYNGTDIVATAMDSTDGWPNIHCVVIGDSSHSYENRTSIWRLSTSVDFIGHPFSVESLLSVLSGQLTRLRD